jgi:hypothetical protein
MTGLSFRAVLVGFVVSEVALGHVSLKVLRFSFVIIIPLMLRIHLCLNSGVTESTSGQSLGTFKQRILRSIRKKILL